MNVSAVIATVDADGDGSPAGPDCNDANRRIRPGAREIRGNRVDENCDRRNAPFLVFRQPLKSNWSSYTAYTDVLELQIAAPKGSKGQILCLGNGCPFRRKTVKRKRKRVDFVKALQGSQRRFRPGQTVEVRITARGYIGKVVRYPIRSRAVPDGQARCLPPGSRKVKKRCKRIV